MTRPQPDTNDALLWRARRIVAVAKSVAADESPRRIRWIEADLFASIKRLDRRARELGRKIEAAARQKTAASAYIRSFNLGRR